MTRVAGHGRTGHDESGKSLLLDVLFNVRCLEALAGLFVLGGYVQRLLQELAGLEAVAAGVAPGLYGGLARGRNDHLDDAWHYGFSMR